jgi:hypothetical protein
MNELKISLDIWLNIPNMGELIQSTEENRGRREV